MRYYKLNEIYVEYDELHGNFYHWNSITRIGKKDKISERTARKLVAKILTPIFEYEFREMFDHVVWLKTPLPAKNWKGAKHEILFAKTCEINR